MNPLGITASDLGLSVEAGEPARPEARPNSFRDPYWTKLATQAAEEVGVRPGLLVNIMTKGERSNADQVSEAGARTPFQIIPSTRARFANTYGVDAYADDLSAARVAALHLKESMDRGGDESQAAREYHGGTDSRNWGPRTAAYVQRVTGEESLPERPRGRGTLTPLNALGRDVLPEMFGWAREREERAADEQLERDHVGKWGKEPSFGERVGASFEKGVGGLKVTWDFLANKLERAVTGAETDTGPILAKSAQEYSLLEGDPKLKEMLSGPPDETWGQAAEGMARYLIRNPSVVATFLAEQVPGIVVSAPIGGVGGTVTGAVARKIGADAIGVAAGRAAGLAPP
jgi:hypothetical protein